MTTKVEHAAPSSPNSASANGALLACILDNIPDFAYMKGTDGRYLVINAAGARFLNKLPGEIVGKDDFQIFPEQVAQRFMEEDRAVFASGASLTFEQEFELDGKTLFLHTVKSVTRDERGNVTGLVGIARDIQERKHLERTLRQRERDLVEAQRIARIGTWRYDRASDTTTWSDEVYKVYQWDRAIPLPSFSECRSVPDPSPSYVQFLAAFDRAIQFGEPYMLDMEIQRRDGSRAWISARGEVESWQDGRVASLRGTIQEITDRKELELALRQRERELVEAQRAAGVGTWRWDRDSDTVTWSEEIYRIFGLPTSHRPENYAELKRRKRPESQRRLVEAFSRAIEFGEPYAVDMEVFRADGSRRWMLARGEVETCRDGKVASLRGTVIDITERKLREEQIALSENRYRSLVTASSQIVWVTNANGNQMSTIPEWQAFTGQSDTEVLGFGWANAIHPEERDNVTALWQQAIKTGSNFEMEQRIRRHDGVYRTMAVRAVPVRDGLGHIVEWVGMHTDITEQKLAEQAARRAHQQLEDVLESITDGLCVLDHDWRYVFYNKNGARMAGLLPEDIIGKQLGEIYTQNKTNAFGRNYRLAMATGKTTHFEEYYGEPLNRWIECNCYPSQHGLTVYFRDISERKQIESALRDSESRYRKLFESNLMGICKPDRFGAFREGNDELLRITGYSREDLDAGLVRWDKMTPPEYASLDATHIAEAAERGHCSPYEKEYIRKDGTRVPILCGYALLEGSQDEYIGFVFDLTRQRAAERAARDREQNFRMLTESLPELIWINDPQGNLTFLNKRFLEYLDLPAERTTGFDWRLMAYPEEIGMIERAWSHSLATGDPYVVEIQLRRHDGVFRHFLSRALPMRNEAGDIEQWIGSCTDIHDQKLSEVALRRSEKLAATGRLAASIAHEINNPLSAVVNSLFLAMQDPELSANTRSFLKTAEEELARVSHITTQTLRFHRQSKAAAFADVSETMESVLTLFRPRFRSRQIEVDSRCQKGAVICCFEDEVRQVFANFVSNSLDATSDRGRIRIRVRRAMHQDTSGVRVTFADDGCGIAAANRQRIFEPFFSTKDSTGIGLGLWVSDAVIRKHGAVLRMRSKVADEFDGSQGHGTVFSIFFPHNSVVTVQ